MLECLGIEIDEKIKRDANRDHGFFCKQYAKDQTQQAWRRLPVRSVNDQQNSHFSKIFEALSFVLVVVYIALPI
ncbi:MAG: hypothetical protein ACRBM6_37015 [Geminicoccales bacterium]